MRGLSHLFHTGRESLWIVMVSFVVLRITTVILAGEKRVAFYDSERNTIRCDDCVLLINEGKLVAAVFVKSIGKL